MPDIRACAYVCANKEEADRHGEFARAMRVKLLVPGHAQPGQRFDRITLGRRYLARVDAASGEEYRQLMDWYNTSVLTRLRDGGELLQEPRSEPTLCVC